MATAILNPVLSSVSGSVGSLLFYQRHGKTIMRAWIMPPNPNSIAQSKNRSRFRQAMSSWQALGDGDKSAYKDRDDGPQPVYQAVHEWDD